MQADNAASKFSRRQFGQSLSALFAGAYLSPKLVQGVTGGRLKGFSRSDAILINSNENPYGPSSRAVAAITGSEAVAAAIPTTSTVAPSAPSRSCITSTPKTSSSAAAPRKFSASATLLSSALTSSSSLLNPPLKPSPITRKFRAPAL